MCLQCKRLTNPILTGGAGVCYAATGRRRRSRPSIDGELVRAARLREGRRLRGPVLTGSWCVPRGYGEGGVFFAPQCSGMSVPTSVFFSRGKRRITSSRYS